MRKKVFYLIICVFFSQIACYSQINNKFSNTEEVPKEFVYVHFNKELLFTGENVYYSVYCLNSLTNKLSDMSKIAYVELIGEDGVKLFTHKIRLINGRGQGDFKIPINVTSGNYKLIGYTQWMKNSKGEDFFKNDITILNPYNSDQKIFSFEIKNKNVNEIKNIRSLDNLTSKELKVKIEKEIFKSRSKASISLLNTKKHKINISLSVRKIDDIDLLQQRQLTTGFFFKEKKTTSKSYKEITFYPELRGELISGVLLSETDNKPLGNENVSLSIPQKDFILKVSKTNNEGRFYFNINENYVSNKAMFQILGNTNKKTKIIFDKFLNENLKINFGKFKISKKYNKHILKRSIYNQIENEYIEVKQDSLIEQKKDKPFFGNYDKVYKLEDYNRFSTVKEVFVEIIKDASIITNDNDKLDFYIKSLNPYKNKKQKIAVIIDGVLLEDYSTLLSFSAKKINKISLKRTNEELVYGNQLFDGFLVFETYNNDFVFNNVKGLNVVKLFRPELDKKYFQKKYFNNSNQRIPDYRSQLLWVPKIEFDNSELSFDFFTSDNIGKFEINIEGFTEAGNPISIRKYFIVE